MNIEKRVNVIDKAKDNIIRVSRSLGNKLVSEGTHNFTSKGNLKCRLSRANKLTRNYKKIDALSKLDKSKLKVHNDPFTGKQYIVYDVTKRAKKGYQHFYTGSMILITSFNYKKDAAKQRVA